MLMLDKFVHSPNLRLWLLYMVLFKTLLIIPICYYFYPYSVCVCVCSIRKQHDHLFDSQKTKVKICGTRIYCSGV